MVHPLSENGKPDYSRAVLCQCSVERERVRHQEWLLRYCQLPAATEALTLDSFQTRNFACLKNALAIAQQVAIGSSEVRWLTLMGGRDRGKTRLAIGICRAWLDRRQPARYGLTSLLLKELRDGYDFEGEMSYRQTFDRLCKVGLLVLDDLGVENPSDWALEQLQTIIDYRYINALHTVITTNRPLTDLFYADSNPKRSSRLEEASARIASRCQREKWTQVVVLTSPEHRLWGYSANSEERVNGHTN